MKVSPFGLSKVGRGKGMDIPGEGVRLPHVKKISNGNQDQANESLLGKEIRPVLSTPRKASLESRYGLTMWITCKGKNLKGEDALKLAQRIRLNQERERERATNCEQCRLIFELSCEKETIPAKLTPDAALVYKLLQEKLAMETNSK